MKMILLVIMLLYLLLDECELLNITVKSELAKKRFGELMLKDIFSECRKSKYY